MKLLSLSLVVLLISTIPLQTASAQAPATVRLIGCLQGDGSEQKPWVLAGAALPPPPAAAPAGGGGGGRGARGGGAAAPAPAAPPAPVQLADFRLTGGMNMTLWRGMKIEVEGVLGTKPAGGLQEFRAMSARSVQGLCTPKQ